MQKYTYYKTQLAGQTFPYACLDMELFYQNIATNLVRASGKRIRIASKSIRCPAVMRMILDYNEQYRGVMTYHGQEAVYLSQEGFDDLLMGYPVVDRQLLLALGEEVKKGKIIYLMADKMEHLERINEVGETLKIQFLVCLDIDLSDQYPGLRFGVWRSGIQSKEALVEVLGNLKLFSHIRLAGVMGYEAQIAGVGDAVLGAKFKNKIIQWLKKRSLPRIAARRQEAVELIRGQGVDLDFVNGGGTGSLESTVQEEAVTEVTVGSGFYHSHLFDYYRNFNLKPALFYAVQIVREPVPGVYTCHGGGFIASGGVEATKAPIVHLPQGGILDPLEGAGEVQTPIRFPNQHLKLAIGDPVFLRHAKAGELCERFNRLLLLEGNQLRSVPTYRGLGQSFG